MQDAIGHNLRVLTKTLIKNIKKAEEKNNTNTKLNYIRYLSFESVEKIRKE